MSRLHAKKASGNRVFADAIQLLSVEIEKEKGRLTQFKQPYYRGEIMQDSPTNNTPIKVLLDNQRNKNNCIFLWCQYDCSVWLKMIKIHLPYWILQTKDALPWNSEYNYITNFVGWKSAK